MNGDRRISHAERVLALLRAHGGALTAYQILDALRDDGVSAPPTVYRALARLTADGAAHRIESLNAYMACACPDHGDTRAFLICDDCGAVTEVAEPQVDASVRRLAQGAGFAPSRAALELRGRCAACA
jgi:Fur family zinc uptake transcriptional regulator